MSAISGPGGDRYMPPIHTTESPQQQALDQACVDLYFFMESSGLNSPDLQNAMQQVTETSSNLRNMPTPANALAYENAVKNLLSIVFENVKNEPYNSQLILDYGNAVQAYNNFTSSKGLPPQSYK